MPDLIQLPLQFLIIRFDQIAKLKHNMVRLVSIQPGAFERLSEKFDDLGKYERKFGPVHVQRAPFRGGTALNKGLLQFTQLITLVLRKLLASSTFAIANTLEGMANRLEEALKDAEKHAGPPDELALPDNDYESAAETAEEWRKDDDDELEIADAKLDFDPGAARQEAAELRGFVDLARRVAMNAKGQELLSALEVAFSQVAELGA